METSVKTGEPAIDQRDDEDTRSNQAINQTSSDTVQLEILKLLKEMRDDNVQLSKKRKKNPRYDDKEYNDYNDNENNNGRNYNNSNNRIHNNKNRQKTLTIWEVFKAQP